MNSVIKKGMSKDEIWQVINDAEKANMKKKQEKKSKSLKNLGGLLSHLKISPMDIQKEMRDGWSE